MSFPTNFDFDLPGISPSRVSKGSKEDLSARNSRHR